MDQRLNVLLLLPLLTLFSCNFSKHKEATQEHSKIVILPDGSSAFMNVESSIAYDEDFVERVVTQRGEVFYVVTQGKGPFEVRTELGTIAVTGTQFNVNMNDSLVVEVKEGSVRLSTGKHVQDIGKGQKAIVKDKKSGIELKDSEPDLEKWIVTR